tara:strand:- start:5215 stop:6618 length:1404 start_codon:yes stop_codon:yes gene_type:complete
MNDFSTILNSGQSFIKDSFAAGQGWNKPYGFILITGIVMDVKREVDLGETSSLVIPQYSIKAKIVGDDVTDGEAVSFDMDRWYIPLHSIHNISIPEVGEEILITRENLSSDSQGYWIDRVNSSSHLNRNVIREGFDGEGVGLYGVNINAKDENRKFSDIQPKGVTKRYPAPALLGDVIQQGRSGTFVRHSFNPRNKAGVLEMGIMQNRVYSLKDDIASIGRTNTKTIHLETGRLSDLGGIQKETKVDIRLEGPFQDGSYQNVPVNILDNPRNIIANIADEIYNISIERGAESTLHRHVLGEKLSEYQEELGGRLDDILNTIDKFVKTTSEVFEVFLNHTHGIPEINIQIPEKEVSFKEQVRLPPQLISGGTSSIKVGEETITIPNPPTIRAGEVKTNTRRKKIKYDEITIGGEQNKRETTKPETSQRTAGVNSSINELFKDFRKQSDDLLVLTRKSRDFLSKKHYLN